MSDDTIHNPSAATHEETETTMKEIVKQPNVTESPAETTPPAETTLLDTIESAGADASQGAHESAANPLLGHNLGDQTDETDRMHRRGRRRNNLKMSKEQLMTAIGEVTDKLGHVPSHAELMRSGKVNGRQIVKHFGTYTRALRACNLERSTGGKKLPLEKLFLDWARVVRELKKIPSRAEFAHMGKHSDTPLKTRFGSWGQVPRYLRRYMEEQGLTEEWKDVME